MSTLLLRDPKMDTLVDTLMSMREECEDHRKIVESKRFWADCEASYFGRLYDDVATPEWMSRETAPKTWESVERIIPILTDSRPRLLLTGRSREDGEAVRLLALGVDQEEDRQNMMVQWTKLLREGLMLGTSFVLNRVERVGAKYRLRSEVTSTWNVYADPAATTDEDLQFVWIKRPIRGSRLLQLFPGKEQEILEAAASGRVKTVTPSAANYARMGLSPNPSWGQVGSAGAMEFQEITRSSGRANPETSYFDLWEGYYVDGSILDIEEMLRNDESKVKASGIGDEGAIITMIGDLVLSAMPNPFLHGQIPLTRFVCYDLPGSYYGMSFIEALLGPHRMLSRIDNKVVDYMSLTCDPEKVMDDDCGVDEEMDYAAPGKKVAIKPGSRYENLEPPAMPQYVWNLRAAKEKEFNDASGQSDVSKGNISGVSEDTSGRAIELLVEPTIKRARVIQRNFESTVSRWGKQTVANLVQFKSEAEWRRVLPPETAGQPLPWASWSDDDFKDYPDVKMAVGSSLPINKTARRNEVLQMYTAGLYGVIGSPEAIEIALDKVEDEDKDRVIQGMMAAQQRMVAQQQQMAAQAQGAQAAASNKAFGAQEAPGQTPGNEQPQGGPNGFAPQV